MGQRWRWRSWRAELNNFVLLVAPVSLESFGTFLQNALPLEGRNESEHNAHVIDGNTLRFGAALEKHTRFQFRFERLRLQSFLESDLPLTIALSCHVCSETQMWFK